MSPAGDPSSRQRLLELADQVASAPEPSPSSRRIAVLGAVAVLAVLVLGIGAAIVFSGGDDRASAGSETTTAGTTDTAGAATTVAAATTTEAPATTAAPTTEAPAPTTTEAPATTVAPSTTEAPATTVEEAPTTTAAENTATDGAFEQPVRWAEFSGGKVYLEGVVPDQATADEIRDKAAAVVGPDNVIVMYEIVPGAPRPPSAPLYVRDSVLFAKNSVDINAAAKGVLDLGVVLMNQNPQITIDISGHTDSDGTTEMNQSLSERRVQVILDYLVSQGIDPARLTTAAFGETQPIADNATAAGRAANRRVEFQINNLLG